MSQGITATLNDRQLVVMAAFSEDENYLRDLPDKRNAYQKIRDDNIAKYKQTKLSDQEREILGRLENLQAQLTPMYDKTFDMGIKNQTKDAYNYFMSKEVRQTEEDFFNTYDQLISLLIKMAEDVKDGMVAASNTLRLALVISSIAIILGVLTSLAITRAITKPIDVLKKSIGKFSGGDLTVDLKIYGGGNGKSPVRYGGRAEQNRGINQLRQFRHIGYGAQFFVHG